MSKAIKIGLFLLFIICGLFTGCAANKNTYYQKRKKATHISTSQLGRNKYYFSPTYQKKLKSFYKKK